MDSDVETDSNHDETSTVTTFPDSGLCQADSNRSLHYYFDDGSIFIRLSNSIIIYCVWGSQLALQSSFFRDLASLPAPAPGAHGGQFEAFLECVLARFGEKSHKHRPTTFWIMALEMADFFNAPKVAKLAKKWLSKRMDLDPLWACISPCSTSCGMDRALLPCPHPPYVILAETHAKITQHRALCAVLAPPVTHYSGCENPTTCSLAWAHAWWGEAAKQGIAIALIHPTQIPARKILSTLSDLGTSWQMPASCRKLTVKSLKDDPSLLLREEIFIAKALTELKKF
ncbi:hypothetical protein K438DRAFT_2018574 [Mycena galopus ATCC 62051]|nr:hypothetical protein K438DRAFT_2018574 [Mycena galopus ATCC 62051]